MKPVEIEQKNFKNQFGFERDYRATVGTLKKALEGLDDDLPIGVNYDGGFGYTDLYKIILEDGLYHIIGD